MSYKGKNLQTKFNSIFNFQKEQESQIAPEKIQALKRVALELVPKKPLNIFSPLFQDPELLIDLTGGDVQYLTGRCLTSRRRNPQEALTTNRPQAKDVISGRVLDDADLSDTTVLDGYYHHPKGPKKRTYIAETEDTSSSQITSPESSTLYSVAPRLSELALPTHSVTKRQRQDSEEEEENENSMSELEDFLNHTVDLLKNSVLDTVKYDNVYSLLPRLIPFRQYKRVNTKVWDKPYAHEIGSDTVFTVTLFSDVEKHVRIQEIEVLGSQNLRILRKAMFCPFGFGLHQFKHHSKRRRDGGQDQDLEDEQDDHDVLNETLSTHAESGVMFIENCFYIDMKTPKIDSTITDWLNGKTKKTESDFPRHGMGRLLRSLSVTPNKPYCFIHYGKCEHMFVIKDIRLLSDMESIDSFPRTNCTLSYSRYKCSMCSIFPAIYMTKNDIPSGFSPCYFCNDCYYSFHPDDESKEEKAYEMQPYYGDVI